MSYEATKPAYYTQFEPNTPWHAGGDGWRGVHWPSWGHNPNLIGPPRQAINGLGCPCGTGVVAGATPWSAIFGIAALAAVGGLFWAKKEREDSARRARMLANRRRH